MSHRPVVAMFVRNTFEHDSRVTREATTLIDEGFDVVVFAVTLDPAKVGESRQGPIRVVRMTLGTFVWRFVSILGWFIGKYSSAVNLLRRSGRRNAGPVSPAEHGARPALVPTAQMADSARNRLRTILTPSHRFLQGLRFGRIAGERAAALRPVAYHCHDLNSIRAGFRARRIHPAPVIYDAHELWPHRNRPDLRKRKTWIIERADRYFSRRSDAVITVNDSIARHMERRYAIPEVVVLRNIPSLAARSAPPEHGLLSDLPRPRVIYVGGVQTYRGLEQMIEAMTMVREDAVFVAVGPGNQPYRDQLERLAVARGVEDRVRFMNKVPMESVVPTVAQGDLGVCLFQNYCLSYYWTLPNKFFEFLHAGVPVLASNFPELTRLVETYEVGEVVDPSDPAAIARAVNDLLSRPEDLARMHDNALKASQELNWEHERERLVALYRRLLPAVRP